MSPDNQPPPRKRILFVAEAVTLAHLARPLVLAQTLDSEIYEVHFACDPRVNHFLPDNFIKHPLHSMEPERFLESLAAGRCLYDFTTLKNYVVEELVLIEEIQPHLVIGDMRLSLAISCQHLKIPYACITNAHWSPFAKGEFPMPALPFVPLLGLALSNLLFRLGRPIAFCTQAQPFNKLRRYFNQPTVADIRYCYTLADFTLYADIPGLVPLNKPPSNHHYLGFINWSPPIAEPPWWHEVPGERPNVYLTLGTSGDIKCMNEIIKGLQNLPLNLLVASAGRINSENIKGEYIFIADYLPGLAAAQRSSLVVCNGGSGTVYQALATGVPVLGVPANMDQYLTMRYVEAAGAGLSNRTEYLKAKEIQYKVEQLMVNSQYQQCAIELQKESVNYEPTLRFQRFLADQGL